MLSTQRSVQGPLLLLSPLPVPLPAVVAAVVMVVVVVAPLLAGLLQGEVPQIDLREALWGHCGDGASHRAVVRNRLIRRKSQREGYRDIYIERERKRERERERRQTEESVGRREREINYVYMRIFLLYYCVFFTHYLICLTPAHLILCVLFYVKSILSLDLLYRPQMRKWGFTAEST